VKGLVDTSALFALLDEDDANHGRATAVFMSLAPGDLVTHNYVVVEALALSRRRLGAAMAVRLAHEILPAIAHVWVDEPTHRAALAAFLTRPTGPSLVDHASFLVMRQLGLTAAFAFDRDFQAEGFTTLAPQAPGGRHRLSDGATPYGSGQELVSVAEIARRSARPISTIQSWRRRHATFPRPIAQLAAGPVWTWGDVAGWIEGRSSRSARGGPSAAAADRSVQT